MLRQEHLKQVSDDYNNNNDNKIGKHQQKRIGISNKVKNLFQIYFMFCIWRVLKLRSCIPHRIPQTFNFTIHPESSKSLPTSANKFTYVANNQLGHLHCKTITRIKNSKLKQTLLHCT